MGQPKVVRLSGSFMGAFDGTALDKDVRMVYVGKFESAEGPVEVKEEHLDKLVEMHNAKMTRLQTELGEIPMAECPPLQLDHSASATNTVGRVIGPIRKGSHTLEDGTIVPALFGKARILGADNVEKVKDGRWASVSMGADFDEGLFSELTITPFPAAPQAALLSAKNTEAKMDHEKLKKHLTGQHKLTDEQAEEKLKGMDDEGKEKLSKEADEHEAKLASEKTEKEESEKKMSKMTAGAKTLSTLAKGLVTKNATAKLAARKATISVRLSKLRKDAKLTPAEIKKIDMDKLAAKSDEAIETLFDGYEQREPQVSVGMLGTMKGMTTTQLAASIKGKQLSQLEKDARKNMSTLSSVPVEEGKEQQMGSAPVAEDEYPFCSEEELCKLIDEGRHPEAKEHLKKLYHHLKFGKQPEGDEHLSVDQEKHLSALAKTIEELQTDITSITQLAADLGGNE